MDHSEQEKVLFALKEQAAALERLLDAADRTPFGDMGKLLDRASSHAATVRKLAARLEQEMAQ